MSWECPCPCAVSTLDAGMTSELIRGGYWSGALAYGVHP